MLAIEDEISGASRSQPYTVSCKEKAEFFVMLTVLLTVSGIFLLVCGLHLESARR